MAPTRSDAITTARQEELGWEADRSCSTRRCARAGCRDGEVERLPQQTHLLDLLLVEPGSMIAGDLRAT
jgi:hypothetical protein